MDCTINTNRFCQILFTILLLVTVTGCDTKEDISQVQPTNTVQPTKTRTPIPTETTTPTPTQTRIPPTPTLGVGSVILGKENMTLLYVPAGEFIMGNGEFDRPIHTVYLDAFWIDETEITIQMYHLCVESGVCVEPVNKTSETRPSYYGNIDYDNFPVIYVDWNMAKTYCEWMGRRLPTEAEWEKAARGTDGRTYPWGEEISCSLANYWSQDGGCEGDTAEVGKYPDGASIYGALDMAGNVWEWVHDWYDKDYYSNSPSSNPPGPASGSLVVARGGHWGSPEKVVTSSIRLYGPPDISASLIGFRCAMDATP